MITMKNTKPGSFPEGSQNIESYGWYLAGRTPAEAEALAQAHRSNGANPLAPLDYSPGAVSAWLHRADEWYRDQFGSVKAIWEMSMKEYNDAVRRRPFSEDGWDAIVDENILDGLKKSPRIKVLSVDDDFGTQNGYVGSSMSGPMQEIALTWDGQRKWVYAVTSTVLGDSFETQFAVSSIKLEDPGVAANYLEARKAKALSEQKSVPVFWPEMQRLAVYAELREPNWPGAGNPVVLIYSDNPAWNTAFGLQEERPRDRKWREEDAEYDRYLQSFYGSKQL